MTFLTKPEAPSGFSANTFSSSRIDLSWTKGAGAQNTMVRRSDIGYPGARDEGDEVYFGTGNSCSDTGLSRATTYYYSAWSEVTGSQEWSATPAQDEATTYAELPTLSTDAATSVEETAATLNGTVTDDGGEACEYRFEYDTDSGEPYANQTTWTGSKITDENFNEDISSLSEGTKYYFRAQAKNSVGTSSGDEMNFLTKPSAPPTASFSAVAAGFGQIDLSWTKGDGAQRTMIVRNKDHYPANRGDGIQVYFGTGTSYSDTGLSPATTYYYSAWSEVSGSQQWSDACAEAQARTRSEVMSVGGEVYRLSKIYILVPWISLAVAIIALGILLIHRRVHSCK